MSQYSASKASNKGNGNPNRLPGIPTGARPKVIAAQMERTASLGSAAKIKTGQVDYNKGSNTNLHQTNDDSPSKLDISKSNVNDTTN